MLKATLDRLEGAKRKKKKRDAFEVMRTASKVCWVWAGVWRVPCRWGEGSRE